MISKITLKCMRCLNKLVDTVLASFPGPSPAFQCFSMRHLKLGMGLGTRIVDTCSHKNVYYFDREIGW